MRVLALTAGFALTCAATAQANDAALFSSLDTNSDSYLSNAELQAELARGSGWIAIDRDSDERISREEFQAVKATPPKTQTQSPGTAPASGYSARRLIGTQARDFYGEPVGVVNDILLNAAGNVTGLVVGDSRVPWIRAPVRCCRGRVNGRPAIFWTTWCNSSAACAMSTSTT